MWWFDPAESLLRLSTYTASLNHAVGGGAGLSGGGAGYLTPKTPTYQHHCLAPCAEQPEPRHLRRRDGGTSAILSWPIPMAARCASRLQCLAVQWAGSVGDTSPGWGCVLGAGGEQCVPIALIPADSSGIAGLFIIVQVWGGLLSGGDFMLAAVNRGNATASIRMDWTMLEIDAVTNVSQFDVRDLVCIIMPGWLHCLATHLPFHAHAETS